MSSKIKIDDLTLNEELDRTAMSQVSGGARKGPAGTTRDPRKIRFQSDEGKGWATRFRTR